LVRSRAAPGGTTIGGGKTDGAGAEVLALGAPGAPVVADGAGSEVVVADVVGSGGLAGAAAATGLAEEAITATVTTTTRAADRPRPAL